MLKEWYISIEGTQKGPFTKLELKKLPYVTPDTLVWRQGFDEWKPIRYVEELKDLFKDDESVPVEDLIKPTSKRSFKQIPQEDETITLQKDPLPFFLWILVILLFCIYAYIQFHRHGL